MTFFEIFLLNIDHDRALSDRPPNNHVISSALAASQNRWGVPSGIRALDGNGSDPKKGGDTKSGADKLEQDHHQPGSWRPVYLTLIRFHNSSGRLFPTNDVWTCVASAGRCSAQQRRVKLRSGGPGGGKRLQRDLWIVIVRTILGRSASNMD